MSHMTESKASEPPPMHMTRKDEALTAGFLSPLNIISVGIASMKMKTATLY